MGQCASLLERIDRVSEHMIHLFVEVYFVDSDIYSIGRILFRVGQYI